MKVLIVGSVAYDSVETATGKVERALGGAATFSAVAASFYCEPAVVAVVGDDFKDEDLRFLQDRGIDLDGLQRKPGKTFHWAGKYLPDMIGRQTLDTQLNVFETFDPILPEQYRQIPYLFLANIHPGLQLRVLDQMAAPRLVVMDTMDLWINTARKQLEQLLPRVDALVINDEETRMLTGEYNVIKGAKQLLARVRQAVIVKRGEHGSALFTPQGMALVPAYPVEELADPTGAGDTYAGALIGHLAQAQKTKLDDIRQALLRASALSSFTVEDFSLNRLRNITPQLIEQRVRQIIAMARLE